MLEMTDFPGRQEGEPIDMFVRGHLLYLLWRLLTPTVLLMAALAAGVLALRLFPAVPAGAIFLGLWLVFFLALWVAWRFALWYYDYFIITDRRVIDFVRRPFISEKRNEAQLSRIQDVRVVFPDPLATMLNYGHVIVQTAGMTGPLEFRYAPRPGRLQARLLELVAQQGSRAEAGPLGQVIEALRTSLDAQQSGTATGTSPQASGPSAKPPTSSQGTSRSLRGLVFVPPPPGANFRIWRKHWLILVRVAFRPAVVIAVALGLWVLVPVQIIHAIAIGLLIVGLLYLAWQAADWFNDVYVVTEDRIIDIEKVPFVKEDRREARLTMIQDVNYSQPNFVARLFNFGDVVIQTAGRTGAFTFSNVPKPREVQQEIFRRWERARLAPRAPISAEAAQDFVGLLDRHHEMRHKKP